MKVRTKEIHLNDSHNHELTLKVLLLWHRLFEYPNYCWNFFELYHANEIDMSQISLDPCLLKKRNGRYIDIFGILVDDPL